MKETELIKSRDTAGSITVNIGKPDKNGRRHSSVEFTVKRYVEESDDDYEIRFKYFENKAMEKLL